MQSLPAEEDSRETLNGSSVHASMLACQIVGCHIFVYWRLQFILVGYKTHDNSLRSLF